MSHSKTNKLCLNSWWQTKDFLHHFYSVSKQKYPCLHAVSEWHCFCWWCPWWSFCSYEVFDLLAELSQHLLLVLSKLFSILLFSKDLLVSQDISSLMQLLSLAKNFFCSVKIWSPLLNFGSSLPKLSKFKTLALFFYYFLSQYCKLWLLPTNLESLWW